MKKLLMFATAAFLFTGAAFAGDGKNCCKGKKSCDKKEADAKKDVVKKDVKTTTIATTKKG